jgi:hypothetical protein
MMQKKAKSNELGGKTTGLKPETCAEGSKRQVYEQERRRKFLTVRKEASVEQAVM